MDDETMRDAVAILVFQGLVGHTHTPGDLERNVDSLSNLAFYCANRFMNARIKLPLVQGQNKVA